jgi:hypothetical protein
MTSSRIGDDEDDYRIERLPDGTVQIKLGPLMPFEVPPETAIRLAALLAKKVGCEVLFRQSSMKIKFPRGFSFGDANSTNSEPEKVN